jgi:predicted RNA-binding protein
MNTNCVVYCKNKVSGKVNLAISTKNHSVKQVKEKIKLMQKAIKNANLKNIDETPIEYTTAWDDVYKLSGELREYFENINASTMEATMKEIIATSTIDTSE